VAGFIQDAAIPAPEDERQGGAKYGRCMARQRVDLTALLSKIRPNFKAILNIG
jgi:hypothetical protein